MDTPFPQSYWVCEGLLCAGYYPGALDVREHTEKLVGLLRCGIRLVINLIPSHETGSGGLPFVPYEPELQRLAASRSTRVECLRMGYADGTAPTHAHMKQILDHIDASLAAEEPVYMHCWGGHGRTSTTIACYLIRHGHTAQVAIDQILKWRARLPKHPYPFEGHQEEFVREWRMGE